MDPHELKILIDSISVRCNSGKHSQFSVHREELTEREWAVLDDTISKGGCLCGDTEECNADWFTFSSDETAPDHSKDWLTRRECIPANFLMEFASSMGEMDQLTSRLKNLNPKTISSFLETASRVQNINGAAGAAFALSMASKWLTNVKDNDED